jgi:hypothetical protein
MRMRRALRILLYGGMVTSLLLCVVSGVLWVRSYRVIDSMTWFPEGGSDRGYGYVAGVGVLSLERVVLSRPVGADQREYASERVTARDRASHRRWMGADSWYGFGWLVINFVNPRAKLYGCRQYLSVPYWFLVLCAALLPAAKLYRRLRGGGNMAGRCARCGYDLRATPERCPECGKIAVADAAPTGPPRLGDASDKVRS